MIAALIEGMPDWLTVPLGIVGWFLGLMVLGWAYDRRRR